MGVFNDLLLDFTSSNFNIFIASKVFAKTEEDYWRGGGGGGRYNPY